MGKRSGYWWCGVVLAVVGLAGCGERAPEFQLDMRPVVANRIVPQHQREIAGVLEEMFGTPDEPLAPPETGLDVEKLQMAAGPVWSDQQGRNHGLFRRHCATCHGISGDGRGPTAMIVNPYPRDYRRGVFKFKSTYSAEPPTDDDLQETIYRGIPGTAMPAFVLLMPDEIDTLSEYVKYLSMRGQMERALVNYVAEELDFDPASGTTDMPLDPAHNAEQRSAIQSILADDVAAAWRRVEQERVVPDPEWVPAEDRSAQQIAASVAAGHELFVGQRATCAQCHGQTGLGDGPQVDQDIWNKANLEFIEDTDKLARRIETLTADMKEMDGDELADARAVQRQRSQELAERREVVESLLPPRNADPRNLQLGVYRGGRKPLDLFRRVHQGIAGTPMPAGGPTSPGATGTLTEKEIWQLVDFVRSLPHESDKRLQEPAADAETMVELPMTNDETTSRHY